MIVVKLGGSVLTDKSSYRTLRRADVERLAGELAPAAGAPRSGAPPLVLVHGAGSFGHVLARKHGLAGGARGADDLLAAAQVHADVRDLDAEVLRALRARGVPAFGVPPWAIARLREGRLEHLDLSPLLLAPAGVVPVTHGDVVPDATRGVGILSGDDLVREVGLALRAAGEPVDAVFALAADGVLDPRGRLVERLAAGDPVPAAPQAGADVTGGIVKKVEAARALARVGARVRFVSGLAPGRLAALLADERVPCTEIEG